MIDTERAVAGHGVGRRSPRWCLLQRSRYYFGMNDLYLDRFRLIGTPLFSVMLQVIHRPDQDRVLHDHPWPFFSFVLWGRYVEEIPMLNETYVRVNRHRKAAGLRQYEQTDLPMHTELRQIDWFNVKHARSPHRIVRLTRRCVVTLVFTGRRLRTWGFHTSEGWVDEREFLKDRKRGQTVA